MTLRRSQALWAALLLLSLFFIGCARCGQDDKPATVATLTALTGSGVTRDHAAEPLAWEAARSGSELAIGDGARTDANSTAVLTFVNGTTLALKPNTTVRLLLEAANGGETAFDVQAGEAVLRVGGRGIALRTHVGLATIAAESEVSITRIGDAITYNVALGELNFRDRDAAEVDLNLGDSVNIGIGMAVLGLNRAGGTDDAGVPEAQGERPPEEVPTPVAGSSEEALRAQPGPPFRHMSARAGESFVVHTPDAPISIGFAFGNRCPGAGVIELLGTRQAFRGEGRVNVLLTPGIRTYTLRCAAPNGTLGRLVGRGSVQVLVDPGTRKLPAKAPTSQVEADGRTYRIFYQNQLPEVMVRWPEPPAVDSYTLTVDGKPMVLTKPEHLFRSGTLRDGVHTLSFQAQTRRSRTTTVEVLFDNVAPKASLSEPDDRAFEPGSLVTVSGVALPAWKVALEGGTVTMGSGHRFSGQVQTSPESPYVAVRLSHPRLGTHYYLRRASGSP